MSTKTMTITALIALFLTGAATTMSFVGGQRPNIPDKDSYLSGCLDGAYGISVGVFKVKLDHPEKYKAFINGLGVACVALYEDLLERKKEKEAKPNTKL